MFVRTVRVFFEKKGRAVYISHLDLTRAMGRALVRSGLPVWYTQGFHPHLYMTFALPLSLGTVGLAESMDIRLTDEVSDAQVVQQLAPALPEGLRVVSAADPVMEPKQIMWADYRLTLRCVPAEALAAWAKLARQETLPMEKRGKKGMKTVDIKPLFSVLDLCEQPNGLLATLRCRAGVEMNLNPALALEALTQLTGFAADQVKIERFAVLNEQLQPFC